MRKLFALLVIGLALLTAAIVTTGSKDTSAAGGDMALCVITRAGEYCDPVNPPVPPVDGTRPPQAPPTVINTTPVVRETPVPPSVQPSVQPPACIPFYGRHC